MALVKNAIGPAEALKPVVLSDIHIISRDHDIEIASTAKRVLQTVAFVRWAMKANHTHGWYPAGCFLR